ncbi:plant expansin-like protein [Phanerochaete sordida]|uniref:Plant expansin-like protein n=1 Tax=Phanerochaete sordida TaxID=48140 RepID=A0A9P3LI51_9APHY|nr:plant expansin-like protein [Phanerochaete sordida]
MLSAKFCASLLLAIAMSSPILAAPAEPRAADVDPSGTHSGDGTWFNPGLGACGFINSGSDFIVAVGHELFDTYPGYSGGNPNNNPICGRRITANYNGASVTVEVVDRCVGCNTFDLDFSPSAFSVLAPTSVGRIHNVVWSLD